MKGCYQMSKGHILVLQVQLGITMAMKLSFSADDIDYIAETFPLVKRNDEPKYGEYRTKRVSSECYQVMAESMNIGRFYQSLLDPPPADPKVAEKPF